VACGEDLAQDRVDCAERLLTKGDAKPQDN
jgi:hypothetical protein